MKRILFPHRITLAACVCVLAAVQAARADDGTNGNDLIFFEGTSATVSTTLTNAYSGQSVAISGEYNVNNTTYDGLGGFDTLFFTNLDDYLLIRGSSDNQMVSNMEGLILGDGADVLNVSDTTFTLGDLLADGGRGDDLLWSSIGNDEIRGRDGNDIIHGGPGNDVIAGNFELRATTEQDDDILHGGDGDDTINGNSGIDHLYGDGGQDTLLFFADKLIDAGPHAGKYGSDDTFDGGSDFDVIQMTAPISLLTLLDDTGHIRITSVERIEMGLGNDALDLAGNAGDLQTAGLESILMGDGDDLIDLSGSILGLIELEADGEDGLDQVLMPDGVTFADLAITDGTPAHLFDFTLGSDSHLILSNFEELIFSNGARYDLVNGVLSPEPTGVALLGVVGLALLGRRMRKFK